MMRPCGQFGTAGAGFCTAVAGNGTTAEPPAAYWECQFTVKVEAKGIYLLDVGADGEQARLNREKCCCDAAAFACLAASVCTLEPFGCIQSCAAARFLCM